MHVKMAQVKLAHSCKILPNSNPKLSTSNTQLLHLKTPPNSNHPPQIPHPKPHTQNTNPKSSPQTPYPNSKPPPQHFKCAIFAYIFICAIITCAISTGHHPQCISIGKNFKSPFIAEL